MPWPLTNDDAGMEDIAPATGLILDLQIVAIRSRIWERGVGPYRFSFVGVNGVAYVDSASSLRRPVRTWTALVTGSA
jgi:hypothetical protein